MPNSTVLAFPDPDPFSSLAALFDADAATDSIKVAKLRATTLVSDLDVEDAARAGIVSAYVAARSRGDVPAMADLYLLAGEIDVSRPGESSLVSELDASGVGDLAQVA